MKASTFLILFVLICLGAATGLRAQQQQGGVSGPSSSTSAPASVPANGSLDTQGIKNYLLGPGDSLDIRVFGQPDFNTVVDVDSAGNIELPFVDKPIPARCRNEREVAKDITTAYSKYLKNPQISVRVTGRNSRPPAIVHGAVAAPQRVQMQRTVRLNELIAIAGGVTERSNGLIQVLHTEEVMCPAQDGEAASDSASVTSEGLKLNSFNVYKISELLAGNEAANPVIRPGDVVRAMESDPVYITGSVMSPQGIYLRDQLTISRALAMVGGVKPEARKGDIRIYRQKPGTTEKEVIHVDLAAIKKQKKEDVLLKPFDVIEVPEASPLSPSRLPTTLLTGLNSAVTSMGASLPLRVIY